MQAMQLEFAQVIQGRFITMVVGRVVVARDAATRARATSALSFADSCFLFQTYNNLKNYYVNDGPKAICTCCRYCLSRARAHTHTHAHTHPARQASAGRDGGRRRGTHAPCAPLPEFCQRAQRARARLRSDVLKRRVRFCRDHHLCAVQRCVFFRALLPLRH